jgi:hypothetical protein
MGLYGPLWGSIGLPDDVGAVAGGGELDGLHIVFSFGMGRQGL